MFLPNSYRFYAWCYIQLDDFKWIAKILTLEIACKGFLKRTKALQLLFSHGCSSFFWEQIQKGEGGLIHLSNLDFYGFGETVLFFSLLAYFIKWTLFSLWSKIAKSEHLCLLKNNRMGEKNCENIFNNSVDRFCLFHAMLIFFFRHMLFCSTKRKIMWNKDFSRISNKVMYLFQNF